MPKYFSLLMFVFLIGLNNSARATTVRTVPLPQLVQRSDTVVRGDCLKQESFWQGPRIYTLTTLKVREVLSPTGPSVGDSIDVVTPGGVVFGIGQRVDGAASIPPHGEVVLHLSGTVTGEFEVLAMGQGVWVVGKAAPGRRLHGAAGTLAVDLPVNRPGIDQLVGLTTPLPHTLSELRRAVQEASHAP